MKKLIKLGINLIPSKSQSIALTFHNICKKDFKWLEDFIDSLNDEFEFINPNKIQERENINKGKRQILITFDDAFKSNLLVAEEILQPRNIKAIFFVTFGFVGLEGSKALNFVKENYYPKGFNPESKYNYDALTLKDIKRLIKNGHSIGAHTYSHPDFKKLNEKELFSEIINETNIFEKKINNSIKYFSYPFGSPEFITKESINLVRRKFERGFTNIRGGLFENKNKLLIFRQNITPGYPTWKISAIIKGKLDFYNLKKRFQINNI